MYEVRLIKKDGTTTLVYVTTSLSDVKDTLPDMKQVPYDRAEIWLDGERIKIEYQSH